MTTTKRAVVHPNMPEFVRAVYFFVTRVTRAQGRSESPESFGSVPHKVVLGVKRSDDIT